MVWQGSAGDRRPYADLTGNPEVGLFGWLRHLLTAALCLMVSGLLRLAEFFVAQGAGGVT